ncbi:MAG: GspH/FimT family pseudopilin [Ideonella sp.]|nr:GspH/FimT family pseudopilin [Ideonella sp.]
MKRNLINPMRRGFTLIEALVTVAILSVILTLTMPSAVDWIVIQRVKANAAEVAADIRFGRGESIKRNQRVVIAFKQVAGSQTCYVVHTRYNNMACNCTKGAGNACNQSADPNLREDWDTLVELKTVTSLVSTKVAISPLNGDFAFMAPNGYPKLPVGVATQVVKVDGQDSRVLNVVTNATGRPQVCAPAGSRIVGYPACPV